MREKRIACRVLVGIPEGKRSLERPGRRLENIKMDVREMGWLAKTKILNSVASVRERTIPTERPPLFGEVSAIFADRGFPTVVFSVLLTGAATFSFK
jgi:hypothetical protein